MEEACKDVIRKVNHKLFSFGKKRTFMSRQDAILVYKSTILSQFDYGSFLYGGANKEWTDKMQRLQNRGLRICLLSDVRDKSVEALHLECGVQMLSRRRDEMHLVYMYKCAATGRYLKDNSNVRVTRTYNKKKFDVKRPIRDFFKRSPLYRGSKMWDLLDEWYQESDQKMKFKMRIRQIDDLHTPSKKGFDAPEPPDEYEEDASILITNSP